MDKRELAPKRFCPQKVSAVSANEQQYLGRWMKGRETACKVGNVRMELDHVGGATLSRVSGKKEDREQKINNINCLKNSVVESGNKNSVLLTKQLHWF